MIAERYPTDLVITVQDFGACRWKEALAGTTREGYSSMWQAFSAAARQSMEEGQQSHGKSLWLLADACSMMLSPKSANEPFKPFTVMEGRRSVIPDDLPDPDIAFFAQIVDGVDDPWLKARLADLVWTRQTPRDVRFALAAIDAYRSIPLDTETWVRGGRECWERAISLARMLRAGAGHRLMEMQTAINAVFDATTRGDGFLALWLAELLVSNGLGRDHRTVIAQKLELLARTFDGEGDLHRAREYFRASSEWFKTAGDEAKSAEMTVALAEGWVKEAVARVSSENPSHMVASSFYENAIQAYRTIPRSERTIHRVDDRIVELRTHLNESGEKSLHEMGVIKSPGVDISQLVENARNAVRNKSPLDALKAFANLHRGENAKQLRQNAIERLRNHPLQALFAATVMSRDGRVIAKRPGMGLGSTLSEEDEIVIRSEMIRDYGILVGIVVQGDIWPALEVLLLEHRLREADFIGLASQSPIVPKGRERLFGKALFAGYDRDFVTAIHLLVPQIEHMVRVHLKRAGAKTTTLDINGIENENGLSTLMDLSETEKVFGEDLSFELKALFCDSFGPNLRNELAHGLLDDDACQSVYAIYAWWFGLRLVFNTYWNANRKDPGGEKGGEKD
jgi:hypothetical protein